ncbi:MAG: lasso peptide biosynthesis B2 protein [Anaerolineae bacterium]|nr:lasso peptide biosynthesis B2 protein [Anaerolineae bacterium]
MITELSLHVFSFPRVQAWLVPVRHSPASLPSVDVAATAVHLGRLVDLARRHHLLTTRCLSRSLVLQRLLYQRGVPTELQIGVRRGCGTISAHAWLEVNEQVVGEDHGRVHDFARLMRTQASQ